MKEPIDFLSLIECLMQFTHKDSKVSLIEYYHKKYLLAKPKLFVYGSTDLLLRPFLPWSRKRLDKFYRSLGSEGNVEIHYGNFSHVIMDSPLKLGSSVAVKNKEVTALILRF